jgi:hypothetical protein
MAFVKQRGRINTVTGDVPILVPAARGQRGLPATFALAGKPPYLVRVFEDSELERAIQRLPSDEKAHFLSVVELKKALECGDKLALRRATDRLQEALELRPKPSKDVINAGGNEVNNADLFWKLGNILGLSPGRELQAKDIWYGIALTPKERENARWLLSRQLSQELLSVQLVLWWTGDHFTPALHCPYAPSALYVRALLLRTLAICPHCGTPFSPKRRDQQYCSIPHREAHRVARWRAGKKKAKRTQRSTRRR